MTTTGRITKIAESDREATFEWEIDNAFAFYESPRFDMSDTSWRLWRTLPFKHYSYTLSLYELSRLDKGDTKYITFTITVKDRNNRKQDICRCSKYFDQFYTHHRSFYWEHNDNYTALSFKITVTCNIKCDPAKTKSSATQTNGKWSSLNLEEIQFETIGTQTNVSESVIENEKPEDGDWPPLDMKGVALQSDRMKDLLNKGNYYDVTIRIKNKEFRAHRNILSARSPVFAMMLTHDTKEKNAGTIDIEDCDPDSFEDFLLHVYSGRNENLTPGKALQLYYPADKYDFPVLKERCVNLLKSSLSITSICDVVLLAAKHAENELLQLATEFFARNMKQILVTVEWQRFLSQNTVEANELLIKSMEILHPEK